MFVRLVFESRKNHRERFNGNLSKTWLRCPGVSNMDPTVVSTLSPFQYDGHLYDVVTKKFRSSPILNSN